MFCCKVTKLNLLRLLFGFEAHGNGKFMWKNAKMRYNILDFFGHLGKQRLFTLEKINTIYNV